MTERRLKETIATYNAVASDYEQRTNHLAPTEELPRFTRLLAAGAKVLDAGCGSGRHLKLINHKIKTGIGIDYNSKAIKEAGREKRGKVAQAVEKAKGFMPLIRAPSWFKWKWPSLKKKNGKDKQKAEEPTPVLKKEKYSLGEKEEKRYYKKR